MYVKCVGGCVKYVVVSVCECVCLLGCKHVCVCRDSCICQCVCFDRHGYADVISYQPDVVDLQSNIPAPPNMAVFPNYCTYMFLLCFCFICMIISFSIKQSYFSSKENS